jgi:hypothetical protein
VNVKTTRCSFVRDTMSHGFGFTHKNGLKQVCHCAFFGGEQISQVFDLRTKTSSQAQGSVQVETIKTDWSPENPNFRSKFDRRLF